MATLFFVVALLSHSTVGLNNGAGVRPPLGWNPYNAYGCNADETDYNHNAYALWNSKLYSNSYNYILMDCGWQSTSRTSSGTLTWDEGRFPSGIPALSGYVHNYGLMFGMYSDAGSYSCDQAGGNSHWPGSLGNEGPDAATFAAWGVDYLKYDNCFADSASVLTDFNPSIALEPHFTAMRDALANTGRQIFYAIDTWGVQEPATWGASVANSWRIGNDVSPTFESIKRIINHLVPYTQFAGPGAWNDLDLLEVGNDGMTEAEWGTQFAFWACAKSPIIVSTDLTSISDAAIGILTTWSLIQMNQDPLGKSIEFKRRYTDMYDVWAGPLEDGSTVVVLINWSFERQEMTLYLSDVGFVLADITDVWTGSKLRTASMVYSDSADGHGSLVYQLTNTVQAPQTPLTTYYADASSNAFNGGALLRSLSDGRKVASDVGNGGTFTFVGIDGGNKGGERLISLAYVNADVTYFNSACSNCRRAYVSINGRPAAQLEIPISGGNWDAVFDGYLFSMHGFVPGSGNTVTFYNPDAWTPDILSIGVGLVTNPS